MVKFLDFYLDKQNFFFTKMEVYHAPWIVHFSVTDAVLCRNSPSIYGIARQSQNEILRKALKKSCIVRFLLNSVYFKQCFFHLIFLGLVFFSYISSTLMRLFPLLSGIVLSPHKALANPEAPYKKNSP